MRRRRLLASICSSPLALATTLASCRTTTRLPPSPPSETLSRFNPDFILASRHYRLRGSLEHRITHSPDQIHGSIRLSARVEPWIPLLHRFGNPSPAAGAELGFLVMPANPGHLHFGHGGGTPQTSGDSGIDQHLLESRIDLSPPSNTKSSSLLITATAVVSVRDATSPADGQRNIEILIPIRWTASIKDQQIIIIPDPSNPPSPFSW